jgi:hypothetical protein
MKTSPKDNTAEFTKRTLMALLTTLVDKAELDRQIETLLLALAGAYGLPSVLPDSRLG